MSPEMFYTLLMVIALCVAGSVLGAFFYGFHCGARFQVQRPDPTPEWVPEVHDIVPDEIMLEVAYLPSSTGPISIEAPASFGEIVGSVDIIADLHAQLARAERLRKRYLRLLREERKMALGMFARQDLHYSPYWKRWVNARMQIINEFDFGESSSSVQIANTR